MLEPIVSKGFEASCKFFKGDSFFMLFENGYFLRIIKDNIFNVLQCFTHPYIQTYQKIFQLSEYLNRRIKSDEEISKGL